MAPFRYKISIPMKIRQVYKMTGFNGAIPSIETEAFPILNDADGIPIEAQTSKVTTESSFVKLGDKSLMILETRYILICINGQNKRNTQISIAPIRIFLH